MEFRSPTAAVETNTSALKYLTENLQDHKKGKDYVEHLISVLGNSVESYPDWHPILNIPLNEYKQYKTLDDLYEHVDHTRMFVRGFVTCPYSEDDANKLVSEVNKFDGLYAYRTDTALYSDKAYPVVVEAINIALEADGTIRSRDALAWCTQELVKDARNAQCGETWWNLRSGLLGSPHGSRSSLLVNQFTGGHMRKILEVLNDSGMYGPIKEWSLEMLSKKKRDKIGETLLSAALKSYKDQDEEYVFELCGEVCKAQVRDTWNDKTELSIRVEIGNFDLLVTGFYYPEKNYLESSEPKGKRALAEKFL